MLPMVEIGGLSSATVGGNGAIEALHHRDVRIAAGNVTQPAPRKYQLARTGIRGTAPAIPPYALCSQLP